MQLQLFEHNTCCETQSIGKTQNSCLEKIDKQFIISFWEISCVTCKNVENARVCLFVAEINSLPRGELIYSQYSRYEGAAYNSRYTPKS